MFSRQDKMCPRAPFLEDFEICPGAPVLDDFEPLKLVKKRRFVSLAALKHTILGDFEICAGAHVSAGFQKP